MPALGPRCRNAVYAAFQILSDDWETNSFCCPLPRAPDTIILAWLILSALAFRELYNDIETWGTVERIKHPVSGQCRWLTFFIVLAELFLSTKFIQDAGNIIYDAKTPFYIWVPWTAFISYCFIEYFYLRFKQDRTTKYPLEYYADQSEFIKKHHLENFKNTKILLNQQKKQQ